MRFARLFAAAAVLAIVPWLAGGAAERDPTFSSCGDDVVAARVAALNGRHFPLFRKQAIDGLRLWAIRDGARAAVPFQIDECGTDGSLLVPVRGKDPRASSFGARSVLLFRLGDAGEHTREGDARVAYEIEVETPHGKGFLYFGVDPALARSPIDEVDYLADRDRVHAERYSLGFGSPQTDYFSLADGKGHDRGNLIDRLKARVRAHFLWGLIAFERDESQVHETVLGAIDGPIRVIRRTQLTIEIGWGLPSPVISSDDYFYAEHGEGPIQINLPFSLAYVFGDLDVRIFLDFRDLDGFEVLTRSSNEPIARVGEGSSEPRTMIADSFVLRRNDVALLHRLRFGPSLRSLTSELVYVDDPKLVDPPESEGGARPAIGYRLTGWNTVGRGGHEIWLDMYVVDPEEAKNPRRLLDRLGAGSRVNVRLVEAGA